MLHISGCYPYVELSLTRFFSSIQFPDFVGPLCQANARLALASLLTVLGELERISLLVRVGGDLPEKDWEDMTKVLDHFVMDLAVPMVLRSLPRGILFRLGPENVEKLTDRMLLHARGASTSMYKNFMRMLGDTIPVDDDEALADEVESILGYVEAVARRMVQRT